MTQLSQPVALRHFDGDFHGFVETSITRHYPRDRILRIERRLNDYHSSFAIEEVSVHFDYGRRLPLIFKNLSPDGLLDYARQIRPHFSYRSQREIAVYRHILAGAGLGTPLCYGARVEADRGRYWLLLEKVAGNPLAKTGEFSIWCDAARWLAEMHCRLAEAAADDRYRANLLNYDDKFFEAWIDRAEHFHDLRAHGQQNGSPLPMRWLAAQCRRAVQQIHCLPRIFIHGEFYASNVLISRSRGHVRICPIDWETAAIGPGLLDLAALVAGNWTEDRRTELALAYYDALPPAMRVIRGHDEFFHKLRCCRLFMAIKWLGWSSDWEAPDEHRCDWLAEAMQLAPTIDSTFV